MIKVDVEEGLRKKEVKTISHTRNNPFTFEKTKKVKGPIERNEREKVEYNIGGKILIEWVVARYHALRRLYIELFLYNVVGYLYIRNDPPLSPHYTCKWDQ